MLKFLLIGLSKFYDICAYLDNWSNRDIKGYLEGKTRLGATANLVGGIV